MPDASIETAVLRRALPAVPGSVTALRHEVVDFVAAAGVADGIVTGVRVAVSEAVTNVVVHAYADVEAPGEVRVLVCVRDDVVLVTVTDDGCGMAPRLDSPGLGVGLPVIANAADTLDIGPGNGGGTELRMSFRNTSAGADRS